jgi:hypothetical protein
MFSGVYGVLTTNTLDEAYKRRNGPKRIFAYNVPCTYIVAREKTFFKHIMEPMTAGDRFFYEVIEEGKPCHLYIDIDVDLETYRSIDVHMVKDMVCGHVEFGLREMEIEIENILVADSSNNKKGSLHILYRLKNKLWRNNAHVGAFMRSCMERRVKMIPEDYETWHMFVDMCVYSRNRLFRMTGCTKKHQNRIKLIKGQEFNYENWLNSLVQPIFPGDCELIEANEPDGSPAVYIGAKTGQLTLSNLDSTIKEKLLEFTRTISPVRGISYCPFYRTWSINLQTKDCIFKRGRHQKNTMYVVVYLDDQTYRMKCWNEKYPCCIEGMKEKLALPDTVKKTIHEYMDFPISPSVNID